MYRTVTGATRARSTTMAHTRLSTVPRHMHIYKKRPTDQQKEYTDLRKRSTKEIYERDLRKRSTKEIYERDLRKRSTKEICERDLLVCRTLTGAKRARSTTMAPAPLKLSIAAPMAVSSWNTSADAPVLQCVLHCVLQCELHCEL